MCPKATFSTEWIPPNRRNWFPFRPVLTLLLRLLDFLPLMLFMPRAAAPARTRRVSVCTSLSAAIVLQCALPVGGRGHLPLVLVEVKRRIEFVLTPDQPSLL